MSEALRRALGETQADVELLSSHLALIRDAVEAGEAALSLDDLYARLAKSFVVGLGYERTAMVVREGERGLRVAASFSQTERFGGSREAASSLCANLASEALAHGGLLRWGGGGVGPRRRVPNEIDGSAVAIPIVSRKRSIGAVICFDVIVRPWTLATQRALSLVGQIIGQVLGAAEARFEMDAAQRQLEVDLSSTSARLARLDLTLSEHVSRIGDLSSALANASRVKETFLGLMSHELRTPLAAILGYSSILREGAYGALAQEQARVLARIDSNARRLTQMLEDMLFLSEAETTRVEPSPQIVDLRALIEDVTTALPRASVDAPVDVEMSIGERAERLECDPGLLRRAVFHLLDIALRFTEAGTVRIETAPGEAGGVVIRVFYTAAGDRSEARTTVTPVQSTNERIAASSDAGLGLSLVRVCASLLNGRARLDVNAIGHTCAELWVPSSRSATPPGPRAADRAPLWQSTDAQERMTGTDVRRRRTR